MDIRDYETRHLISKGLSHIQNPFFAGMIEKQAFSLKGEITPIGIAFYIAPYINATVRVGTQQEKMLLFESMLEYKALDIIPSTKRGCKGQSETRVEQACRTCNNVKSKQTKARDEQLAKVEKIIEEQNLLENKILVVRLEMYQSADKNLTGLIANQLMSKYQRPVLLLNEVITEHKYKNQDGTDTLLIETTWEGSGRGYDKSKFQNLREFLKRSGYVLYADGHPNALGVGIADTVFDTFIEYSNNELRDMDFTPCYNVDFIFNGGDFKGKDIIDIASMKEYWGQNMDEPYIAIENITVANENITLMSADKNPTLKIMLPNGTSLIKFKSSKEEYENLHSEYGSTTLTVIGRCEMNVWNGVITPQILVEAYEITGKVKYYF